MFCGMLQEWASCCPDVSEEILDSALDDSPLAPHLPNLQVAVGFDASGIKRLVRSSLLGRVPALNYLALCLGGAIGEVSGAELATLIFSISKLESGFHAAIEILRTRYIFDKSLKRALSPDLMSIGRKIIKEADIREMSSANEILQYDVISLCLSGNDGYSIVKFLCNKLIKSIKTNETSAFACNSIFCSLFRTQPKASLDAFFAVSKKARAFNIPLLGEAWHVSANPIDHVGDDLLLAWCGEDAAIRFPLIASVTEPFDGPSNQAPHSWSTRAKLLVHKAPDPVAVMRMFTNTFLSTSWSGSLVSLRREPPCPD